MTSVSPLAPTPVETVPRIEGIRFSAVSAGVRYEGRDDVMLAELCPGTSIAGVFTRSATRAAPVLDCQSKIGGDPSSGAAILVNSGNANAFTGRNGADAVANLTQAVGEALRLPSERVFTSSTGVIGEALPAHKILDRLSELHAGLDPDGILPAARAIMTTDTFPKVASAHIDLGDGKRIQISGMAKGSGMIAPDMATMLVYIFTDAKVDQGPLQELVSRINERTFNCITVDSDTSTSDTLLVAATGTSGVNCEGVPAFEEALESIMLNLAHQVVRDGEGATKFIEVRVTGAKDNADAKRAAMSVANSPLVKTAVAGEDPNWGRIVMAIGKSGAAADRDRLSIRFGDILVAEEGWVSPSYAEASGAAYMKQQEIVIGVDLGIGAGSATVWTCDLTHAYISINADYRS